MSRGLTGAQKTALQASSSLLTPQQQKLVESPCLTLGPFDLSLLKSQSRNVPQHLTDLES